MVLTAGMARMRHTLQALQARAQAAMALADKGPASLVQTLTGLLPPLANSGMSCCLPSATVPHTSSDASKPDLSSAVAIGLSIYDSLLHEHASPLKTLNIPWHQGEELILLNKRSATSLRELQ
jgi:hypothetical protein